MVNNLWIYAAAFTAGALGALAVAVFGSRWSLLDRPVERSSHDRATPRGGGIGIAAALIVCSLFRAVPAGFWIPAVALALVSFGEDRFELDISVRLLLQFLLAFCCLFFVAVDHFYSSGHQWGLPLSVFFLIFIVGTANFYNFMDGINGMAGIAGAVAFGLLGAYGVSTGRDAAMIAVCFSLAFACAGFLPFNLPRARVFMGDVGSILLGFVFACLVVLWSASASEFLLMTGFLFLFYADELVTLGERLRDGESPARAHRRHLYQVLANEKGMAHWKVSAGYGLAQLVIGLAAWKAGSITPAAVPATLALFLVVFIVINNNIKKRAKV